MINGSFENYDTCPYNMGQLEFSYNTYNPNQASPDYFNECSSVSNSDVPNNFWGNQNAKSGNAYAAIGMNLNGSNIQEYLTLEFSDTLISGKVYQIEFFISLVDYVKFSIYSIGGYIHNNLIQQSDPYFLNFVPQIKNLDGNFITDKTLWLKIEGLYQAIGGEKFITIGCFYKDSLIDTIAVNNLPISGTNKQGSCYYIDDVYVGEYIEPVFEENKLDISPNPASDFLVVTYELKENDAWLEIYNAIGQLVKREFLYGNNGNLNISVVNLSNGMYFGSIVQNEKRLVTKKLMIIK